MNIGPKFSVGLAASAKLGLTGKMDIGTTLALGNIEMRFPKTAGTSTGKALAKDGPLKLQVTPQIGLGGVFEGHVTPRIALGVDMISGLAKAEVFMEIDGKGSLDLGIQVAKTVGAPGTNVTGCIGLNAGITARAGAEGSVFPFFSKTANFDFFTKEFELFKVTCSILLSIYILLILLSEMLPTWKRGSTTNSRRESITQCSKSDDTCIQACIQGRNSCTQANCSWTKGGFTKGRPTAGGSKKGCSTKCSNAQGSNAQGSNAKGSSTETKGSNTKGSSTETKGSSTESHSFAGFTGFTAKARDDAYLPCGGICAA